MNDVIAIIIMMIIIIISLIVVGILESSAVTVAGICNSVSGGVVFFDEPQRCRWRIPRPSVKARVVNGKLVDVRALRSDGFGCPGMC